MDDCHWLLFRQARTGMYLLSPIWIEEMGLEPERLFIPRLELSVKYLVKCDQVKVSSTFTELCQQKRGSVMNHYEPALTYSACQVILRLQLYIRRLHSNSDCGFVAF